MGRATNSIWSAVNSRMAAANQPSGGGTMNKRLLSVLVFALVVSAAASFLVYRLLSAQLALSAKAAATRVVVASHNLPNGALIKDVDVKMADWGGPVPAGSFTKP